MENRKVKSHVKFQKGDLVLIAHRISDKKKDKCAILLPPFESPFVAASENNVNSYKLKYRDEDSIRGIFNITDIYEFKQ